MKLITEQVEGVEFLEEASSDGKKATYIVGPFIAAECRNKNGRWYPAGIVENEVKRYIKDYVEPSRAVGELNHPPTPQVNYERGALLIKSLHREGNSWIGKAKVMESLPMGKIAKGLLEEGVALGVSTRGMGSLREDSKLGAKVVNDDFRLCAVDLVSDPSGPGCWVQGIMEGAEWVYDAAKDQWSQVQVDQLAREMKAMPARQVEEDKALLFERFIRALAGDHDSPVRKLARETGVSESRVRELWDRSHDVEYVRAMLGEAAADPFARLQRYDHGGGYHGYVDKTETKMPVGTAHRHLTRMGYRKTKQFKDFAGFDVHKYEKRSDVPFHEQTAAIHTKKGTHVHHVSFATTKAWD